MRTIVIYYSQTGDTKAIDDAIYQGMKQVEKDSRIVSLKDIDVRELPDYKLVGIGSPVFGFQEPPNITDSINSRSYLKDKYGFCFCTHGTIAGGYTARMVVALKKKGMIITDWNDWYGSVYIPTLPKPYFTDGHPDAST